MAKTLAEAGIDAIYSYAGRTAQPAPQPLPTRIGGFGGVAGLIAFLAEKGITHVIDATHPFAAGMSRNAFTATTQAGVPLMRLERPKWHPKPNDQWTYFSAVDDVPNALPQTPARIFLAIGKQQITLFAQRPEHHYLLRLVDPPIETLPMPNATLILARGPFDMTSDTALLRDHAITHVVAKNAGGTGARAKLDAARTLGLPVMMVDRPPLPGDTITATPKVVMQWLSHNADRGV